MFLCLVFALLLALVAPARQSESSTTPSSEECVFAGLSGDHKIYTAENCRPKECVPTLAVEHGFGGPNSRQKAQDLVNDIEGMFKAKNKIDPYDFACFLEDEVDDRFDLMLEDGSVQMIASHVCQCFLHLKEGRIAEVEQFLQGLPNAAQARVQAAEGDDSSDEDDDEDGMDSSASQPQHYQSAEQQDQCSSSAVGGACSESPSANNAGDASMDVEEEDGWTVVKKGGRKR